MLVTAPNAVPRRMDEKRYDVGELLSGFPFTREKEECDLELTQWRFTVNTENMVREEIGRGAGNTENKSPIYIM